LDSIREYVQNAFDSILTAERDQLIRKNEGEIIISIDAHSRSISIRDNGEGLSSADVTRRLLDVGMSGKQYGQDAGFRGIGRLAGMAYCRRVNFITSSKYEDEVSTIVFDCDGIRKSISPAVKQVEELTEVLKRNTRQDLSEASKDTHFFEVRLEELDDTVPQFLDVQKLEDYLCQVAPVEYDAQMFIPATKIEEWVHRHDVRMPHLKLILQDKGKSIERQVFKPYRNQYATKRESYTIDVKDVRFYPEDFDEKSRFWMWYSVTDLLGMFDDPKVSGLRFRRDNIGIGGPERVAELFPGGEGRLNHWVMGEVHILANEIIPNARRDGFEASTAWESLKEDLQPFVKTHCKACHDASSAEGRPAVKLVSSAQATVKAAKKVLKVGLASQQEREDWRTKLAKQEERIAKAHAKRESPEEKRELASVLTSIRAIQTQLEEKEPFVVGRIRSALDRKQRKLLIEVLEVVSTVLSKANCPKGKTCLEDIKREIVAKYHADQH
jgi:molecular chaperone HtpG